MTETENPAAADVFYVGRFDAVMAELRSRYDYLVLDVPAMLTAADARVIAPLVDGILFVVRANATSRRKVLEGLSEFGPQGGRIAGVILNAVKNHDAG